MFHDFKKKIKMGPISSLFFLVKNAFHRALLLRGSDKRKTKQFLREFYSHQRCQDRKWKILFKTICSY